MKGAELRILFNDGSVAIQTLENGKAVQVRPFPVVKDLPEFAAFASDGTLVLGVSKNGIKCWPVSPLGKNDLDIFEASAKGLTQFQLDAFDPLHKISDAFQSDVYPLTIMAQDPRSPSASARSCVTQLSRDQEGHLQMQADWHSPFAPICPLSPGIVVAQDSKAFVLPFHGGSLSGPLRHESAITAICGIREGLVATGSADGAVKLWNLTRPAFPAQLQSGPVPENEGALLLKSQSHDVEIRSEESGDYVIKSGAKLVKIEMPPGMSEQSISSAELSGDGQWGILSGFREDGRGGAGSGAWIFRVKDGKLLSGKVGPCEWAGFSPDRRQVLTIEFGRLTFWDLGQDANGTMTFAKTQPVLAQADMAGAGIAANGTRIATRSVNGEVIVWNKADGKPLQTLRRNPLWNDVDLDSTEPNPNEDVRAQTISCKPALNADGRLLATAYGRGFVIWDVDSGKPLSDPVICAAEIRSLEFSASDSTKVIATLRDGSSTSWDHATHGGSLVKADLAVLQKLALAVANDQWVDEVPKLAANTHPALPVVAKLLEHFASQARALREKGARSAPAVRK